MPFFLRGSAAALLYSFVFGAYFSIVPKAEAQQEQNPQSQYYVGEGEVDLLRGVYLHSRDDISIGVKGSPGELVLTRYYGVRSRPGAFGSTTGHSQDVAVYRERFVEPPNGPGQNSYRFYVMVGNSMELFEKLYGTSTITYLGTSAGTQRLTEAGATGPYTYTGPNGLTINFDALTSCPNIGFPSVNCGVANTLTKPSAEAATFHYDTLTSGPRLRLVKNNFGYALGFDYRSATSRDVLKVCSVNLADNYVTTASPCPVGSRAAQYVWPTSGAITGVTDPAGQTTTYTYSVGLASIKSPASASADITISYYSLSGKVSSLTYANGAAWTYTYQTQNFPWDVAPSNYWTEVTTPLSNMTLHNLAGPRPQSIQNPLGQTRSFQYVTIKSLLQRITEPEGNYTYYTYGVRDNVTETRIVAKSGSGLSDIVSTAAYPATCTNYKTCDKPTSVTDARGNTTDYTYDTAHGGVLTETGPAVGGIRPQKRYTYTQRYAWIKNSGGTYVQAPTPVWLLTAEEYCKTTAASGSSCAGGASDEVVTAYDYGPNSGPNNLTLRGVVVDSGGLNLRTCFGYDSIGNRISQTEPNAGLTSCP
mgnify:CR=1 FL=1